MAVVMSSKVCQKSLLGLVDTIANTLFFSQNTLLSLINPIGTISHFVIFSWSDHAQEARQKAAAQGQNRQVRHSDAKTGAG
jgi:hypothetical protein